MAAVLPHRVRGVAAVGGRPAGSLLVVLALALSLVVGAGSEQEAEEVSMQSQEEGAEDNLQMERLVLSTILIVVWGIHRIGG